ncbi:hypothetical protein FRC12_012835, partial [Ceratobasidium sp. 428]
MLAVRVARRTAGSSPSVPQFKSRYLWPNSETDLLQHTKRLELLGSHSVAGSRPLSLWWGQPKPAQSSSPAASPEPDTVPTPTPQPEITGTNTFVTDLHPPVELTQSEPNVIPDELVSSTSSTLETLGSAPA